MPSRPRRRPWYRLARRRVKAAVTALGCWIAPPFYRLYMGWVWRTSRLVDHGLADCAAIPAQRGGLVALLWHEELFAAGYAYREAGFRAHVLVNRSGAGDLISSILDACGHTVTRGGSSRRSSRRRPIVMRDVIRFMQAHPGTTFGVLVDGSRGPRYRMKPGPLLVARRCGVPVALMRVWFRRCVRLRTWDRAAIPLPWNEIHTYGVGPIEVPAEASSREGLERFRRELERQLVELAARSYRDTDQPRPPDLVARGLPPRRWPRA